MSGPAYIASEDSALLRGALSRFSGGAALEIGAGNGGNLLELSKGFGTVVGTDLVRPSMEDWKGRADYVLADGASCFKDGCFDLVAFNPPYLAEEVAVDGATQGGEGLDVPKKFLAQGLRVAKKTGRIVFLLNDEAKVKEFEGALGTSGFALSKIAGKRLFYEELSVFEAKAP